MFEKEAEEYLKTDGTKAETILDILNEISPLKLTAKQLPFILAMLQQVYQDGAEFGYNKAKEDADKMKSQFLELCNLKDMRIEELEKANEWHYVKDELPEELHDVLCFVIHNEHIYVLQGYLREGRWVLSPLGTYLNNDDVIAWKEIVLPKEIEE